MYSDHLVKLQLLIVIYINKEGQMFMKHISILKSTPNKDLQPAQACAFRTLDCEGMMAFLAKTNCAKKVGKTDPIQIN